MKRRVLKRALNQCVVTMVLFLNSITLTMALLLHRKDTQSI